MLERTFLHVEGVGYSTERRLWQQGARRWRDLLERPTEFSVSGVPLPRLLDTLLSSEAALARADHRYFAPRLPPREHWRALREFPGRIAYLDIETDGGRELDSITMVGMFDGARMHQFVRGENLLEFRDALAEVAVLVTFYGTGFDLPMLRLAFPGLRFDQLHVDLCPALRRLGLAGGLKRIEQVLGISRSEETTGLGGWDAVRLWREWRRGSTEALQLLQRYNEEDVRSLEPLAAMAFQQLAERTLAGNA